ncbi:MAG TPA: histidine phosphatase family protein [Rhizomicrobium sp.]|jgi:broad specificity phosphatase PhoE|nr:histidine phosphatase family protein [Rhizomicrobium sp.]
MPRIYMVRHGRAAAGFGEDMDPGLDALGREQAEAVAARLVGLGPRLILSSPLKRTRETAAPLARLWSKTPIIEPAVAEIPSPRGMSLEDRVAWLRQLMAGSWREVTPELAAWRAACIAAVVALKEETVVFSHYVAINVLMGAATSDDRVVAFSPENCSVTVFDNGGGKLRLLDKGSEASLTRVN